MNRLRTTLQTYWFDEAPATRLAVLRILIGSFSLWYLFTRYDMLVRVGHTDPALFEPAGTTLLFGGPISPLLYQILITATLVLNVAFVVGWRFRITGPAFALMLLVVLSYRNSWSMVYHSRNIVVLHVLILGFTAAADAYSWDALKGHANRGRDLLSRRVRNLKRDWAYGWPIRLICAVTMVLYFLPGVAKIAGPLGFGWAGGEALRSQIAVDALRKEVLGSPDFSPLAFILYDQVFLFTVIGVVSLVVELAAPLFLVNKRLARLWALMAFGMHWGIFFIMGIKFRYQQTGIIFASFFDVEKPVEWVQARFQAWRQGRTSRAGDSLGDRLRRREATS